MKFLLIILFFITAGGAQGQEIQIRKILQQQTDAWNRGDISSYMDGYWKTDSLVFIGKDGPKYGYEVTLANYLHSYPDDATMGKLTFNIVEIRKLSSKYCFVIGDWKLTRSIGDVGGSWTLLFKKIKGKWKIVVDHSS